MSARPANAASVELWQVQLDLGGEGDEPTAVAMHRNRVVVAGGGGGYDDIDAIVAAFDRRSGQQLWLERLDFGGDEWVSVLTTWQNTVFLIGNSFVHAYALADGSTRWSALSDLAGTHEGFFGATVAEERLVVVGTANGRMLVRAYDARSSAVLWEDNAGSEFIVNERATWVTATAERVYVAGSRAIVLGRTEPYVVRAYDARSGKRLWESTFGYEVNTARGLAVIGNTLVLTGERFVRAAFRWHMEVRGLDAASGKVRWRRGADMRSTRITFVSLDGSAILAGTSGALPVLLSYDPDTGTLRSEGAKEHLRRGEISALAVAGNTVIATGGAARHGGDYGLLLRGYDDDGRIEWTRIFQGEATGLAVAARSRYLAVAGRSEQDWVITTYRR